MPQIYVACLASYNAGTLHGAWIEAAQDAEIIREEIQTMLAASPEPGAEEFAIHDFEGFFEGIELGEFESIDDVARIAQGIEAHDGAFVAYLSLYGNDADPDDFSDKYRGEWSSFEDYIRESMEDSGLLDGCSETLRNYFDWESYARDVLLEGSYDVEVIGGITYVFDANA